MLFQIPLFREDMNHGQYILNETQLYTRFPFELYIISKYINVNKLKTRVPILYVALSTHLNVLDND